MKANNGVGTILWEISFNLSIAAFEMCLYEVNRNFF